MPHPAGTLSPGAPALENSTIIATFAGGMTPHPFLLPYPGTQLREETP